MKQETKKLKAGDIVAVYGTLRKGCPNYNHLRLEERAEYLGEDLVIGELYDLNGGGFPGLIEGSDEVKVDLFKITEDSLGASLDGLEGYSPSRSQESNNFYIRASVDTVEGVEASIYYYQGKTWDDGYIESGDWVKWKSRTS